MPSSGMLPVGPFRRLLLTAPVLWFPLGGLCQVSPTAAPAAGGATAPAPPAPATATDASRPAGERAAQEWHRKARELVGRGIKVGKVGWVSSLLAGQIIDDQNMLATVGQGGAARLVWVSGLPTAGIVAGQRVVPGKGAELFEVTGTKTYKAAAGAWNTAFLLEPARPPASP